MQELQQGIDALQRRVEREKASFEERDRKRDEVLKGKLHGLGDVEEMQRQIDQRVKSIEEMTRQLDAHVTVLESRLQQELSARQSFAKIAHQVSAQRMADVGRTLSALTLKSGQSYFEAKILSFREAALEVQLKDGKQQLIPYDQLPDSLQERYSFPAPETAPMPKRPEVDLDAAADLLQGFPPVELSQVQDQKLIDLVTLSNRSWLKIWELRRTMAEKAPDQEPSELRANGSQTEASNPGSGQRNKELPALLREQSMRKTAIEKRLVELVKAAVPS